MSALGPRHSGVVAAPLDEVFDWHSRPGAVTRLTPPWQPVRVLEEADSLRDGRAVLRLPGGLRWVAAHQPDGYAPPHRFVDQLASPLAALLTWRHVHEFSAVDDSSTRVTDMVRTSLPPALFRAMFTYRHNQLAEDLDAHARARRWRSEPVTIAVSGVSGTVGTAVTALLSTGGHRVLRLVGRPARTPDERYWNPSDPDPALLAGVDAVIDLAGPPTGRFSGTREAARERIRWTHGLARCAARSANGPCVFVSASDIDYYGADGGDEIRTEASSRGDGRRAEFIAETEAATVPASDAGLRTVLVRTGIVQTPRCDPLRILFPLYSAGFGGAGLGRRLGSDHRWWSWIGIDDLADIYLRAVLDPALSGPVNAVAPGPVRVRDYTHTLARVLHRPYQLPSPAFGTRLPFSAPGAAGDRGGQRVHPDRLRQAGHHFRHPRLATVLRHVLGQATDNRTGTTESR